MTEEEYEISRIKRFKEKVIVDSNGCWIWKAGKCKGYGKFQTEYAHRASYQLFKGSCSKSFRITQTCGVKLCVNPEHLSLNTRSNK